jgi:hypothetical protein
MGNIALKRGHLYRLTYRLQSGNGRWYKYEATMTYLGRASQTKDTLWNLRPIAGTQTLPTNDILAAEDLGASGMRDDHRHRAKKSLGSIPKPE